MIITFRTLFNIFKNLDLSPQIIWMSCTTLLVGVPWFLNVIMSLKIEKLAAAYISYALDFQCI